MLTRGVTNPERRSKACHIGGVRNANAGGHPILLVARIKQLFLDFGHGCRTHFRFGPKTVFWGSGMGGNGSSRDSMSNGLIDGSNGWFS